MAIRKKKSPGNDGYAAFDKKVAQIKALKDTKAKVKKIEQLLAREKPASPAVEKRAFKDAKNQRDFVQTFQDVVSEGNFPDYFPVRMVDRAAANVARARYQKLAKTGNVKVVKKKK